MACPVCGRFFGIFFFNDTATTEIYTLSLHDALPIWVQEEFQKKRSDLDIQMRQQKLNVRSEEHTSELQSPPDIVCRLLLEKKNFKEEQTSSGAASCVTDEYASLVATI